MDSGDSTRFTFWLSSGVRVPHRVPILIMQAHIKAIIQCENSNRTEFDSILFLKDNNIDFIKQQIIKVANVDSNCDILDLEVQYLFKNWI